MRFRYLVSIILYFNFLSFLSACRIWSVISKGDGRFDNLSSLESNFISLQLDAFYNQSQYNQDGWAVVHYAEYIDSVYQTVFRSSNPANQDSLSYWSIMNSIFNDSTYSIGMSHIRTATSGASQIPNPHPWIFQGDKTYSFVHNGGASKEVLYDLITNNGIDNSWLDQHPPQTFGAGYWNDEGWSSVVDSELIMLLIMQQIYQHGVVTDGLQSAFSMMIGAGINPYMLNCVFSDSENLYIYGGSGGLYFNESDSFLSVMSSPAQNSTDGFYWESILTGELVVLSKTGYTRYPSFASVQGNIPDVIIPSEIKIRPAYPNPFNGSVVIPFIAPVNQDVNISIFNNMGKRISDRMLSSNDISAGKIIWSPNQSGGNNISSGVYVIRMTSGLKKAESKIMFIK